MASSKREGAKNDERSTPDGAKGNWGTTDAERAHDEKFTGLSRSISLSENR